MMMSGGSDKDVRVFFHPLLIRIGYPAAFITWLLAPLLPAIFLYILYNLSGIPYMPTFSKYLSHPTAAIIAAPVWLSVVYLQYLGMKSRSTVRVSHEFIETVSFLGRTKILWSGVEEVLKRRQIFDGSELKTVIVKSSRTRIIFSNRLIGFDQLIQFVNELSEQRCIILYCEDYEVRPIVKVRVQRM